MVKNTTFLSIAVALSYLSCSDPGSLSGNSQAAEQSPIVALTAQNFDEFIGIVAVNMEKNRAFVDYFLKKAARDELDEQAILKMLRILHISKNVDVTALERVDKIPVKAKPEKVDCEKLLEIRDAMLAECDKYVMGIDEVCSAAVMLAYWYKSADCTH